MHRCKFDEKLQAVISTALVILVFQQTHFAGPRHRFWKLIRTGRFDLPAGFRGQKDGRTDEKASRPGLSSTTTSVDAGIHDNGNAGPANAGRGTQCEQNGGHSDLRRGQTTASNQLDPATPSPSPFARALGVIVGSIIWG